MKNPPHGRVTGAMLHNGHPYRPVVTKGQVISEVERIRQFEFPRNLKWMAHWRRLLFSTVPISRPLHRSILAISEAVLPSTQYIMSRSNEEWPSFSTTPRRASIAATRPSPMPVGYPEVVPRRKSAELAIEMPARSHRMANWLGGANG